MSVAGSNLRPAD